MKAKLDKHTDKALALLAGISILVVAYHMAVEWGLL